jgi:hypothetical protein
VAQQVAAAYMTDPEGDEPRAAVVWHLAPDLLPEDFEDTVRGAVEEEGGEFTGVAEFMINAMEFVDEDRVGLFMEGDPTSVIRGKWGAASANDARGEAREWVEETGHEAFQVPLDSLPNVFQYAFMAEVTQREIEPSGAYLLWVPEMGSNEQMIAIRRFPPDINKPKDEGEWNLVPRAAIEEMLADRGW